MKNLGLLTVIALLGFLVGCQEPELHTIKALTQSKEQSDILLLLEQKHPDYFKSIAIYGTDNAGTILLFLVKRGGTFLFRKESDEIERINHAKAIIPGVVTQITYSEKNESFSLWVEDRNELSIRVSK